MAIDPSRPVTAYVHHLFADREDPKCRGRYIRLVIYPNAADMAAAGNRYNRSRGSTEDLTGIAGLFQPSPFRQRYDRKTRASIDTTTAFAGVMRLAAGHLTGEIITHESTHAALHVMRLHDWAQPDGPGNADFGDGVTDHEENFAHLLGAMAGNVNDVVLRYLELT